MDRSCGAIHSNACHDVNFPIKRRKIIPIDSDTPVRSFIAFAAREVAQPRRSTSCRPVAVNNCSRRAAAHLILLE